MRKLASIGVIVATMAMTGCAARSASTAAREPQFTPTMIDEAKVAQINARARGRGVDIIWVNPPTKR
jgi:hypothetical protein